MRVCLRCLTLLLGLLPSTIFAGESYRLDADHSFVQFAVVHTGVSSLRGRVHVLRGTATLDAQEAAVSAEVDLRSIDTGVARLDDLLRSDLFFDVAHFPTAHFSARATAFADGLPQEFLGELDLHGTKRPVQLRAERFVCRNVKLLVLRRFVCGGDLVGSLRRSDFGLSQYLEYVSDEVRLTISVEAIRAAP